MIVAFLIGAGLVYMLCEQILDWHDRELETIRFKIVAHLNASAMSIPTLRARVATHRALGGRDLIRELVHDLRDRGVVRERGIVWELTGVPYDGESK